MNSFIGPHGGFGSKILEINNEADLFEKIFTEKEGTVSEGSLTGFYNELHGKYDLSKDIPCEMVREGYYVSKKNGKEIHFPENKNPDYKKKYRLREGIMSSNPMLLRVDILSEKIFEGGEYLIGRAVDHTHEQGHPPDVIAPSYIEYNGTSAEIYLISEDKEIKGRLTLDLNRKSSIPILPKYTKLNLIRKKEFSIIHDIDPDSCVIYLAKKDILLEGRLSKGRKYRTLESARKHLEKSGFIK